MRSITKNKFSILKREIGWREGVNTRKDSTQHGIMILTFDETALKNLGLEGIH